jgi:hypothetical protein
MTILDGYSLLWQSALYSFAGCAFLGLFRWGIQRMVSLFKKMIQ